MGIKIKVVIAKNNISVATRATEQSIRRALDAMGKQAQGYAADNCPVDTGRLRGSITHEVMGKAVYIGTNVEYAPYVEFIDRYHHPVGRAHFLRDAVTQHTSEYKQIAEKYLKE